MAIVAMDPAQEFEANVLARLKPVHEVTARGTSPVQQFYSGATVFLTGGSGFLGKQLIEKLFRATKVSKIFFLIRSKKGKTTQQRLIEILQDPVYNLLREQQPDFAEKLVPVAGDVAEIRLGLSEEDWNTITEQVDIVFHLAATTRFDESLRVATLINVRGTRETLLLGKACKNLRSFVYVSTAYTHARSDLVNTKVSEVFYKSPVHPNAMIGIAETVDEERINDITPNLIKLWPNTYTFAKSIAEELVNSFGNDLPICVVRPAVVMGAKLEPNPGWVDMSCIYGASGLIVACGLGLMHVVEVENTNKIFMIPVDYVNNLLLLAGLGVMHAVKAKTSTITPLIPVDCVNNVIITAGWETARKRAAGENNTKIYTVATTARNPLKWEELDDIMCKEARQYSSPMTVTYGFVWCISNSFLFWLASWLLHLIPAHIADVISVLLGKKRRFAKLATKMYNMSTALCYFSCNQWHFDDKNTAELYSSLSKEDRDIFNFDVKSIDWKEYTITLCIGLRKYVVKDGLTGTVYARKKQNYLKVLIFLLLPLYFFCLFRVLCFALSIISFIFVGSHF